MPERLRIRSNGKVGIGTDISGTPASSYNFAVYRSSGTSYLYTETAGSGASAGLRAKAGTADFTIFTTQGTGQLGFYDNTNSVERLRITSDGSLNKYISGTTVQAAFPGSGQVNGIAGVPSGAGTPFVIGRDTGTTRSAHFGGHLKFDSGYGIDFSATADGAGTMSSEVLDDYEEGSFTITSEQGGWTISAQNYNRYVKIGELVHAQFYISLSGSGDSNSIRFGGLPYSVTTNGYSVGTVDFGKGGFKGAYMRTRSGTDEVDFYYSSENASNDRIIIDGNEIGSGYVIATISYVTE
jgi:hypothetical protein